MNASSLYYEPVNRGVMSKTDPDSAVVRQKRSHDSRPRYKHHRVVDEISGHYYACVAFIMRCLMPIRA